MNKKVFIISFFIIVIFGLIYFFNKFDMGTSRYITQKENIKTEEAKEIFIKKHLEEIEIQLPNNSDKLNSQSYYFFEIRDKKENIVYKDEISFKEFKFANRYSIDLKKSNLKSGNYSIYISAINVIKNDVITDYKINFKYSNIDKIKTLYIIISIVLIIFIILLIYVLKTKDKIHIIFLKMAIPIFIMYLFFIPMLAGHDETYHWIRAYELSEFKVIPEIEFGYSGSWLPIGINLGLPYDASYKYEDVIKSKKEKIDINKRSFQSEGSIGVYSPIQFIPQIIGINICKLISNNTLLITYVARLFNLITCIFLLTMAIKIAPFGKKILFLLCLNPIAIEGFTTLSGDGITISLSFLIIAYILNLIQKEEKIGTKNIILLCLLSVLLSLCKIIYIIIPFLILIIPKNKYKSKKQHIITLILCLCIPIILNLLWLQISSSISVGSAPFSVPSKNLHLLFTNPIKFVRAFVYSTFTNSGTMFMEMFSSDLLMQRKAVNSVLVPVILIVITIYLVFEKEDKKIKFNKISKALIIFLAFGLFLAVFLCEYVFWVRYNSKEIYGFQGRYLIPIIPIVLLLIKSKLPQYKLKNSESIVNVGCIIVNLFTILEFIVCFL